MCVYACRCMCVYTHVYICIYVCMCVYMYIVYINIYTHISVFFPISSTKPGNEKHVVYISLQKETGIKFELLQEVCGYFKSLITLCLIA